MDKRIMIVDVHYHLSPYQIKYENLIGRMGELSRVAKVVGEKFDEETMARKSAERSSDITGEKLIKWMDEAGIDLTCVNTVDNADNDALTSYLWEQISGPSVTFNLSNLIYPTFIAPEVLPDGDVLIINLTVNDGELQSEPDQVIINVLDSEDMPICDNAQAKPNILWPPNHKLVPIEITNIIYQGNEQLIITVNEVTQDEPVNNLGGADKSPDAVIQGDKFLLRAERQGDGNGRVYKVNFTAEDGNGGICKGAITVCVPHDSKATSCIDDGQAFDSFQP